MDMTKIGMAVAICGMLVGLFMMIALMLTLYEILPISQIKLSLGISALLGILVGIIINKLAKD